MVCAQQSLELVVPIGVHSQERMGLSPEERRKRHAEQTAERDAAYAATGRKKRPKGRAPKDKEWDEVAGEWIAMAASIASSVPAGNFMEADAADANLQLVAVLPSPTAPAVPHQPTAATQPCAVTSTTAAHAVSFSHPWADMLPVLVRSPDAETPLNWALNALRTWVSLQARCRTPLRKKLY